MNIIVYVLDSLRADHLSCYGYDRETTPNIDALADDGVLFERCFSPTTYTRAASASLLTGLSPLVHGTQLLSDGFSPPHPPITEKLQGAGFETAAIGSLPNMRSEWGFNRGFDNYVDMFDDDEQIRERSERLGDDRDPVLIRADDITRGFREWFESRNDDADEPFFSLLWSMETHMPFFPPDEYRMFADRDYDGPVDGDMGSWRDIETTADHDNLIDLYDGTIRYNDDCIADLCEYLREIGEFDDTLLILCGDHGEAFGEHNGQYGHGRPPYEEVIHVPLIIRPPTNWDTDRGRRVSDLTSLLDITPTLVDMISGMSADDQLWTRSGQDGKPLSAALDGRERSFSGHEELYFTAQTADIAPLSHAIRTDEWKFIRTQQEKSLSWAINVFRAALGWGWLTDILKDPLFYYRRHWQSNGGDGSGAGELYYLPDDPTEQDDASGIHSGKRDELANEVDAWIETCERLRASAEETPDVNIEGEAKERLQRLGYLQE